MGKIRSLFGKWEQMAFNFDDCLERDETPKKLVEKKQRVLKSRIRSLEIFVWCPPEERCKNFGCMKKAPKGKVYCSKKHSPFGLLDDEPDNAPVEWTPPETYFKGRYAKAI